jgi:hypothetical protein
MFGARTREITQRVLIEQFASKHALLHARILMM